MYEEVKRIEGISPGEISIVLAGVHGNEKCGVYAFSSLLKDLTITNGTVYFLYGNPRAIEADVRFTDANLNRLFVEDAELTDKEKGSYEYGRAQFLKTYLSEATALLDVHASITPNSERFLICEQNAVQISSKLPFNRIVSGFDVVEPGGTDYFMNRNGKIGICAECGYLGDSESSDIAISSIMSFLAARGHIDDVVEPLEQIQSEVFFKYFTRTPAFELKKDFADFEEIEKGALIGIDGDVEIRSPEKAFILFARNAYASGSEAFLLGRNK